MKEFPRAMRVENIAKFPQLWEERLKYYLRREVYEHVLSHAENDYFSLDKFNERVNNIELTKKLVKEIVPELEQLGWKCKMSYGGTALFIYSTPAPPPNCWDE